MSMVTKCPACNTLFRVTPQQLQAHEGQVRCGRCMKVFDGLAEMPSASESASAPAPQAHAPAQAPAAVSPAPAQNENPGAATSAEVSAVPAETESSLPFPEFTLEPLAGQNVASVEPRPAPEVPEAMPPTQDLPLPAPVDELDFPAALPEPSHRSRWWAVGSMLLLIALAGQAAYVYRTELAANYPGLKPALVKECEAFGCVVPLPQHPKLFIVEASDLQALDPARPNVIQLTATLRNQSKYDLGFPALDLVLTNSKDHTLARRIFMPKEYLERGRDVKAGLAANAEITIRLGLDTGTLGASGFRLDLLPGPAY